MPQIIQFSAPAAPRSSLFQHRWRWGRSRPKLDLKTLPDHLKRDLGFLGGHTSPIRDPLRD
jgi:hypothetical protein